ncbi:MAG: hypothetical protein ACXW3Z_01765 [Limisphaerales bacterium]
MKKLIALARAECAGQTCAAEVEEKLHYFVTYVSRMQYGTIRRKGLLIGSGVIEAGGKKVIGARCNNPACSGANWGPRTPWPSAASTPAAAGDTFWRDRLNASAAKNDCLNPQRLKKSVVRPWRKS